MRQYSILSVVAAAVLAGCGASIPAPAVAPVALAQHVTCVDSGSQSGWVFKGGCVTIALKSGGAIVRMPAYAGRTFTIKLPKNDANGARVTIAQATGKGDIARNGGKKFPLDYASFLYIKIVNEGKPVHFDAATTVAMTIAGTKAFDPPCSAAHLKIATGAWPAYPDGVTKGAQITYGYPASLFGALPHGERYISFECKTPP